MKYLLPVYFFLLFSILLAINIVFLEGIPHVPDDAAYLFMARMFAEGSIRADITIPAGFVDYFPGILAVNNGTWLFQYPFGHPIVLMIGVLFGFPNIIPPLIGVLFVFVLFLIAKSLYGIRTALFLLPLPLLSPFFLENASSFMSHNTAAFYLALSFYFLIRFYKYGKGHSLFLSGIFIGLLFNTRPLTSLPFLILEGMVILIQNRHAKRSIWLYCLGFLLLFFMYLGYNSITNGSPFHFQYYVQNKDLFKNNEQALKIFTQERWQNVSELFTNFGPMIYNTPPLMVYALLLVPFILRKDAFWDRIFFLSLFTLPFSYFFYKGTFIMYGPRFWYEILPFVFLLTARTLAIFSEKKFLTTIILFVFFAGLSLMSWLGVIPTRNPDYFSPLKIQDLKGFNFINNGIYEELERKKISEGVIFVEDCGGNWWCYGSVFSRNTPAMDTPIVYVKDLGIEENLTLKRYYPNKPFYRINYYTHQLTLIAR